MKLEKREITLNEKDSLKDIYYFEKTLLQEYEKAAKSVTRKEVKNELNRLLEGLQKETQTLREEIN